MDIPGDVFPWSISEALSHSYPLSLFYVFVIAVFATERNGYEFWMDVHERMYTDNLTSGMIWLRIIFTNLLMLFMVYIAVVRNSQDPVLHNILAMTMVVFHFCLELVSIILRTRFNCHLIHDRGKAIYISLLVLESLLVVAALLFALCFINVLETCPQNSPISYISEYLLVAIIVITPVFRVLD